MGQEREKWVSPCLLTSRQRHLQDNAGKRSVRVHGICRLQWRPARERRHTDEEWSCACPSYRTDLHEHRCTGATGLVRGARFCREATGEGRNNHHPCGQFEGKHFSGPNDLAIKSCGAIFFTDNDFGLRGAGNSPLKEIPNAVWLIKDSKVTRVLQRVKLGGTPNGIALSPDEKYLYLSADTKLMRYEVRPDDTLGGGVLFSEGEGIGDGIKVDKRGNVYSTSGAGPGIIRIVAPSGKFL